MLSSIQYIDKSIGTLCFLKTSRMEMFEDVP